MIDSGTVARPVSVLGLGAMGWSLAAALLPAGHEVTVWNRSAGRTGELIGRGAREAATVVDAVSAGGPVVVCLDVDASVNQTLSPAADALRDRTIINLTTTTPQEARQRAAWAQQRGIIYLDGAIMATPDMIGHPGAQIFYSGSRQAFDAHLPVLDLWAASTYDGEDAGQASVFDLAMLAGMYTMFAGFLHGAAMVQAAGRTAVELAERAAPFLAAMTASFAASALAVDQGDFSDPPQTADWTLVALDTIIRASRESGVEPVPVDMVRALVQHQIDAGHGADDIDRIIELMRASAGTERA